MLIALSILWGGSFLFVGIAVSDVPPLSIVLVRVFLSALALHFVLRVMGQKFPTDKTILIAFLIMGLLNNAIPFSLIAYGQSHIASGLASILNATTPIFTVIVAHFLTTDEKLTGRKSAGVIIGFFGVAIMIGIDALEALGIHILAQIAVLIATASYAFAGIYGKRFQNLGVKPLTVATGQVTASTCLMLPLVLIVDQPWQLPMPSLNSVLALAALALLSTVLAYILFFEILARAGATNLLLVTFLIPPSAIILGVLVLNEAIQFNQMLGLMIIIVSLLIIDGRLLGGIGKKKSPTL
ncbi:MAG: DMT family transporter [Rhizobiaceae bacterium]|nr:DMT family transporter [Rhizobiaceae bacterium]